MQYPHHKAEFLQLTTSECWDCWQIFYIHRIKPVLHLKNSISSHPTYAL